MGIEQIVRLNIRGRCGNGAGGQEWRMWKGRLNGGDSRMEAIVGGLQQQMSVIADLERQRRELTVSAATEDGRVTVAVDAQGHLVDLEFSSDIGELSYTDIATAVLYTVHEAAVEAERRSVELFAPLNEQRGQMPKLSELVGGFPGMEAVLDALEDGSDSESATSDEDSAVEVPVYRSAVEDNASLVAAHPDEDAPVMEFGEAVDLGNVSGDAEGSAVLDRDWV
ncbi:YbaB/EbfC family nucleoid-associated protein [Nocardia sp. NPDC051750]|uniref:YbaB/EbfC family nucleoid-associated protein n=1 Tax=Nocardia sp. NPDC051750 TaxID=3364325 RepID=UPI00378A33C8